MRQKGRIFIANIIIGSLLFISPHFPYASEGPEVVDLDAFGTIYEPVAFDHSMHEDVASCATCHHHTTGQPAEDENCLRCHKESGEADEITCAGCHPANPGRAEMVRASGDTELFHMNRTGLKRAYHLNCLGCHLDMDAPTGCEDCHPKREGTDDLASVGD